MNKPKVVSKELHPKNQQKIDPITIMNRIIAHTYTSNRGVSMLEVRKSEHINQIFHSEDNGATWNLVEEIFGKEKFSSEHYIMRHIGPFYLDRENNLLVRFISESIVTDLYFDISKECSERIKGVVNNSHRVFYQISRDEGKSWEPKKQLIQKGSEYNAGHWAKDVYYKKGSLYLEAPPFHKLADGTILIPSRVPINKDEDRYGTIIQAGCFLARWKSDLSDLEWETGGRVYGGGCEQTTAILDDGRILNIFRAQGLISPYPFSLKLRPYTISEDGGKTWAKPKPLTYTDGSSFASPRAWSILIRSSKNGKLYWIANILPISDDPKVSVLSPGRADPRHPLQIAEVDEEKIGIKKETVTIIEDKEPGETDWVRFSNYLVYEDRKTKEIVVLMMKAYCEFAENLQELPCPNYRYRIALPD